MSAEPEGGKRQKEVHRIGLDAVQKTSDVRSAPTAPSGPPETESQSSQVHGRVFVERLSSHYPAPSKAVKVSNIHQIPVKRILMELCRPG